MSENDVECLASTGVNTPATMLQTLGATRSPGYDAPCAIILRVQVQFAIKEIDRTNTRRVSFEDSTRAPSLPTSSRSVKNMEENTAGTPSRPP